MSPGPRSRLRSLAVLPALVALGLVLFASIGAASASAAERPFTLRFGANVHGNIAFASNTLMQCPVTDNTCGAANQMLVANNNGRRMQRLDVDGFVDANGDGIDDTETSSSANLTIPPGAKVLFAGLYWAGNVYSSATPPPGPDENDPVARARWLDTLIKAPGDANYQEVVGTELDTTGVQGSGASVQNVWSSFVDVTPLVRAGGSGVYTVGGVPIEPNGTFTSSTSSFGGWAIWVAYEDPSEPWRNLSIFDGMKGPTQTFDVSGFTTPPSGSFKTAVGVSAVEGDSETVGDKMQINGTNLTDVTSEANNFFNSRITRFGVDDHDRTPDFLNQLGWDAKLVDADAVKPTIIPNGAKKASVTITTSGDAYWANAIATAIEIFNPDVQLTKTVRNVDRPAASDVHPGEELEYTVTARNENGAASDAAAEFDLRDAIPADTTYVPGSLRMVSGDPAPAGARTDAAGDDSAEYDSGPGDVVFRLGEGASGAEGGTILPGEESTVSFRVKVDAGATAGGTIANAADATFKGATTGESLEADSNQVETPISDAIADLELEKTGTTSVDPGEPVSWTLKVTNKGPDVSSGATVEDTVPAGVTNVAAPGCTVTGNSVTCAVGPLTVGGSSQITITGDAPSTASDCFENEARVEGQEIDPVAGNDSDTARTCTTPAADLELTKTGPGSVAPGGAIEWTLNLKNNGPDPAANIKIVDDLPAGVTNVAPGTGCVIEGGDVVCALASLGAGESHQFQIGATAPATPGTCVENTAAITAREPADYNAANDSAAVETCTPPEADLEVEKTGPATVAPGGAIEWHLSVTNKGPNAATNAKLTDVIPAGVRNVTPGTGCTLEGGNVVCAIASLANGASRAFTISATAPTTFGTCIENTASASSDVADPAGGNDSDGVETCTPEAADLVIHKTAGVASVRDGELITYTLAVENNGPSASPATTVEDTLPPQLTYVEDDSGCVTTALPLITCELGALANGATATIHVVAEVKAGATGEVENIATVKGPLPDPEPETDEAKVKTPIEPVADLELEKSGPATAAPGGAIEWHLKVTNNGPNAATNVKVTDDVPADAGNVVPGPGCSLEAGDVVCTVASLADGASQTFSISATAPGEYDVCIENTASASSDVIDPITADDSDVAETCTPEAADLAIEKSAGAAAVKPGERITYTLAVENNGPSASPATTVEDTLPPQLTYVEDDSGCVTTALPLITCELGALANGATATIHVVAEVKAGATGEVENIATVKGPLPDPEPETDEAKVKTPIEPFASDLSLEKTASANGPVKVGDEITYTLAATDHGPDPSPQTVVTDNLPAGLTYVSDDAGCEVTSLPTVQCELGTLANGETRSIHIVTRVASIAGGAIANTAHVRGTHDDPDPDNNPDSAETPVVSPQPPKKDNPPAPPAPPRHPHHPAKPRPGTPLLVIKKQAGTTVARPTSVIAYTITVWNKGDGPARNVTVCDEPPTQQKTLRTEPTLEGHSLCWHVTSLAAGAKRVFRLTAEVKSNAGAAIQRNRASVRAANVKGIRTASAPVRVKPLPNRTCGAAAARPGVAFRC